MTTLSVKEDRNGYFTILFDSYPKAYGLTREQAEWYMSGILLGFDECKRELELTDSYYEFHVNRN
jgi:hypothetical protein